MAFKLTLQEIQNCLDELEWEFLRLADEECLHAPKSQFCAFLQLGIRAVWLMNAMVQSIRLRDPDGYYALSRACWESTQLQLEFRRKETRTKVAKWFQGNHKTWNANHTKLDQWIRGLGNAASTFGKEFGSLAELAHPTSQATENSVICALARKNDPRSVDQLNKAVADAMQDLSGRVMREFWIIDLQHSDLINVPIQRPNLTQCEKAFVAFQQSLMNG